MEAALRIQNLQHSYAATPVLHGIDLQINKGESFGLFGPNGAGKTTLMSLATGVLKKQSGTIELLGKALPDDGKKALPKMGFVPQNISLYETLSPLQNLQFFGAMQRMPKSEIATKSLEILKLLGLENVRNKPIKKFSGGMKRRINLAIGVLHNPEIIFLDEPTVGVDVQTRNAIVAYLKQLNQSGTTLVYTSHLLAEAQELCTTLALIDNGKILAKGGTNQVLQENNQPNLEALFLALTGKNYRD